MRLKISFLSGDGFPPFHEHPTDLRQSLFIFILQRCASSSARGCSTQPRYCSPPRRSAIGYRQSSTAVPAPAMASLFLSTPPAAVFFSNSDERPRLPNPDLARPSPPPSGPRTAWPPSPPPSLPTSLGPLLFLRSLELGERGGKLAGTLTRRSRRRAYLACGKWRAVFVTCRQLQPWHSSDGHS
jgi:hypothetical protein